MLAAFGSFLGFGLTRLRWYSVQCVAVLVGLVQAAAATLRADELGELTLEARLHGP